MISRELIARGEGAGLTRPLLTANLTQSAEGNAPVKTPSTSLAHLSMDRAMIRNAVGGAVPILSDVCWRKGKNVQRSATAVTC